MQDFFIKDNNSGAIFRMNEYRTYEDDIPKFIGKCVYCGHKRSGVVLGGMYMINIDWALQGNRDVDISTSLGRLVPWYKRLFKTIIK